MAWWEWLVVLGLWAWAMADVYLLRQALSEGLSTVDQRRRDALRNVEADVSELQRRLRGH